MQSIENIKDKVKRTFKHVKKNPRKAENCNQNKQAIETGLKITRILLTADKHATGIKMPQIKRKIQKTVTHKTFNSLIIIREIKIKKSSMYPAVKKNDHKGHGDK